MQTDRQKQIRALYILTRLENRLTAGSNKAREQSQLRALYNLTRLLHPGQIFQSIPMFKLGFRDQNSKPQF